MVATMAVKMVVWWVVLSDEWDEKTAELLVDESVAMLADQMAWKMAVLTVEMTDVKLVAMTADQMAGKTGAQWGFLMAVYWADLTVVK